MSRSQLILDPVMDPDQSASLSTIAGSGTVASFTFKQATLCGQPVAASEIWYMGRLLGIFGRSFDMLLYDGKL